ncbi:MAG TPA: DUF5698 domain-containing protein [Tepidisphaeraceae bacterium]|nr:DUF5698 domain-containing protein [Tepidisphaeraceae bacterium]
MESLLGALLIFVLRITDVSLGTLRVLYMVRGQRLKAAGLGLVESSIFIFAISRVLAEVSYPKMFGYAGGFAMGTLLGVTIEEWIASGFILVRIISREKGAQLRQRLRDEGFGVTTVRGEGREGELLILFVVALRRRGDELLGVVKEIDANAFVTVDSVNRAIGGYLPHVAEPEGVRK